MLGLGLALFVVTWDCCPKITPLPRQACQKHLLSIDCILTIDYEILI